MCIYVCIYIHILLLLLDPYKCCKTILDIFGFIYIYIYIYVCIYIQSNVQVLLSYLGITIEADLAGIRKIRKMKICSN